MPALIGMEATGNSQWFIELAPDLGHEIWIGDAAQIRASYVRKQKTDKRDAAHILKLVVEGRFPKLWTPDREQRDLRQLEGHPITWSTRLFQKDKHPVPAADSTLADEKGNLDYHTKRSVWRRMKARLYWSKSQLVRCRSTIERSMQFSLSAMRAT